jgi:hypothetical protein
MNCDLTVFVVDMLCVKCVRVQIAEGNSWMDAKECNSNQRKLHNEKLRYICILLPLLLD